MGENHLAALPTALCGVILLMAALSQLILQRRIVANEGKQSVIKRAIGHDRKEKASVLCYVAAGGAAFRLPWLAQLLCVTVGLMWLVPDRRIEKALQQADA